MNNIKENRKKSKTKKEKKNENRKKRNEYRKKEHRNDTQDANMGGRRKRKKEAERGAKQSCRDLTGPAQNSTVSGDASDMRR